jgi:hypothetical protein
MGARAVGVWARAIFLIPVIFALAIAAVSLAAAVLPARQPAGDRSHPAGTVFEDRPAQLTLPVALPAAGGGLAVITVRITTVPPAPEAVDESRPYLTALLQSLVRTLPDDWSPDEGGIAVLKRAIEEVVSASISAKLPVGTRVTASAEVTLTGTPPAPAGPQTPAPAQTPAVPPSP